MSINDRLADDAFKALNKKFKVKKDMKKHTGTDSLKKRNAEMKFDNSQINKYKWRHV